VSHRLFGYRGVVFDVDPEFHLSEEWYEQMARSRPPKDRP
jgi:heat shock protein HspQ